MQNLDSYKPRSISRTLSVGLIITLVLVAALSLGVNFILSSREAKAELEARVEEYTSALTDALKVPLWSYSEKTIEAICASYAQNEFVTKLLVEDQKGSVFFKKEKLDQRFVVSRSRDIFYENKRIGRVHIALASGYYTAVNRQLFQSFSLTIVIMIGTLLVMTGVLLRQFLKKPMSRFIKMVNAYAAGKSDAFKQGIPYSEFRPLVDVLDEMGEKIASQMRSIRKLNEDLEKRVEERTAELRKLSETVEQSPVTVVITDKKGTIEYVNPSFSEVTGYSAKEAIGENPRILKSGNLPNSFYKDLWDTILSGRTWRGEFLNRKKNDEEFWESASISSIKNDEGEITHFVAVKQDITEKKHMEEELLKSKRAAEEANRAKSDFLANMSHEIRTPMNAVIGMAHLAQKTELTPKQRDYLEKIQSSANSLLGIINDILDFSKIEAGKLDMEAVEFDLSKTMDNVANVITVKSQEKENLEVLFYLDSRVPNLLVGDPLRLNQILINLGNNAVKFTKQGEIVLTTSIKKRLEDKVTLQFSMRDTGIGMTAEQQTKLFQAFSQADTSTTRKFGGTGLGLTISKRLVNMMGGEIWVESEPGQGTTFNFTADFGLGKGTVKKRFVPAHDIRGLKVLVVDDNATSRQIFQDILESFSFEVFLAASGEDALEEIEKADRDQPFELVIMDWKMPCMDGIEASERIKTNKALRKIPPIILVTAYGREELMQQADKIGLEGFLLKPVNSSMLFDAIMQALEKEVQDVPRAGRKKEQSTEELNTIYGARVLLVEDNEINQQVALEILQGAGLNVTVANNGQEGVDAAKKKQYDAILMDIQMPVMDGYTASREIRNLQSEIRNLPIIAMTAHAMAGDEQKSIEAGMNDHVTKPIDPDQLFATLQKWIKPIAERAAVPKSLPASGGPPVLDISPEPDQAVPGEDEMPESLPGFDLVAGLSRLMGNKRLYRKLLLDFGANYGAVATEIRVALAVNDFNQAHSLVHNLKGLAGNLEAKDLQVAAAEMETLVKGRTAETTSDKELNQKFADLENALGQAMVAVQALGKTVEKKTIESGEDARASVPLELVKIVVDRIKAAADIGDVMQIKSIAEELKSESDAMAPFCNELVQLAENFDLDGIQKFLPKLDS